MSKATAFRYIVGADYATNNGNMILLVLVQEITDNIKFLLN